MSAFTSDRRVCVHDKHMYRVRAVHQERTSTCCLWTGKVPVQDVVHVQWLQIICTTVVCKWFASASGIGSATGVSQCWYITYGLCAGSDVLVIAH